MAIRFDAVTGKLTMQASVKGLSGREKCQLFNALLDELGLMAELQESPDSCESFQVLWKKAMERHWDT